MPSYQYLRNLLRRYGWTAAVGIVADQFQLGSQASAVLRAAVEFDTFRTVNSMTRPFPGPQGRQKRRRTDYIPDPSSYQQISYHKSRTGRKKFSTRKLVVSNITRTDYWFKGLKVFDDNGFYWMTKDAKSSAPIGYNQCCYIFAPFHVKQASTIARPFRRIISASANNSFRGDTIEGIDANGVASGDMQVIETSSNVNQVNIGPAGMLRWTEFKFNLWGAKNKSTRWYIDFVKPITEDCNPFSMASGAPFPQSLDSQFQEYLRPKTVNPISTANDMSPSGWKIIKRHVYDIDPVDLQEGDSDPHVKQVTLFNRWDRMLRFDWTVSTTDEAGLSFNDPTKNITETTVGYSAVRPQDTRDVFVIICATNYVPFAANAVSSNATDPSFDMAFRSSWARLG